MSSMVFCDSPFWHFNLSSNEHLPQLSQCFVQTVVPVLPIIVAILLLPYDIYVMRLRSEKLKPLPVQWRIIANLLLITSALVISVIELARTLWHFFADEIRLLVLSDIFSPVVRLFSYIMLIMIVIVSTRRGYRNAATPPFFWLFSLLVSTIKLWSLCADKSLNVFEISVESSYLFIFTSTLIVSCLTPNQSSYVSLDNQNHDDDSHYCPLQDYNVFSRVLLFWVKRLLIVGYRTKLDPNVHLMSPCYYFRCRNSFGAFQAAHQKYNANNLNTRLLPLLWWTAWVPYTLAAAIELALIGSNFIQPYLLSCLIDYIGGDVSAQPLWHGLAYAIAYCSFVLVSRAFDSHSYISITFATYRIRSALQCAVYNKMLKLSPTARRNYTSGELNNLLGIDIDEICGFIQLMNSFVTVPISIFIGLYILWQLLGASALTVMGVMLIIIPLTTVIMKKSNQLQSQQMKLKDARMEQISEILNNIKLLKLFGWEKAFMARVTDTRLKELTKLRSLCYWSSASDVCWVMAPMIVAASCFSVYLLSTNNQLNAKTAFVSLSVFNLLRFPMAILPYVITRSIRAVVSFKRIRTFLIAEEINKRRDSQSFQSSADNSNSIVIKDGTFTWNKEEEPTLKNVSIEVEKGSLVAIVGKVGSGKSSIFSAIMGDMYQTSGVTHASGSIAYVPQTAWIQNASLRTNITFISDYESDKYEKVIKACALVADFDMLPARDATEIGEKGINLSGGQKQRVSLARAVYQDSDVYLLDDPLSAVDAHVAHHLFEHVIGPNGLLSSRTRLLATHHTSFLRSCAKIIVLKSGEIIGYGSYEELSEKGLLSEELFNNGNTEENSENETEKEKEKEVFRQRTSSKLSENSFRSLDRQISQISRQTSVHSETAKEKLEKLGREAERAQLIDDEQQEIGNIKFRDYIDYVRRCGALFITLLILAELGYNCCEIGANYWLNLWTSRNDTYVDTGKQKLYLSVYVGAIIFEGLFVVVGSVSMYAGSFRAASRLHKEMLTSILRSPLSFFDVTPLGRIINRFNRDMGTVDEDIPFNLMAAVQNWLWAPLIYAMIWSSNLYLGFQIVFVNIVFYGIYKVYLWTSRQLKRLESTTRSPIYSHYNESISGAVSIRAYAVKQYFIDEFQKRIDFNINVSRYQFSTVMWTELWTGIIGSVITFTTAIFIVLNRHQITASLAGFVIIYSVEVINGISWVIRLTANLENSMVAVERVREYTRLDSEAEWELTTDCRPHLWPQSGRIEFRNYSTCYRTGLEPVLKQLNLSIRGGEKIGIVGRTGAGKSSITLALFRIIEPTTGSIIIDGVDVSTIGLHDLRSKLTIIPQEASLFAGTLRLNLDPFDQYSDQQLWTALENAHLNDFVSTLAEGLEHKISEGGDNLSAGQRQLVCLARALLRSTKILVLDEATAACDLDTDLLIQSTIKENFADCTVLTIAHRLHTVLEYDRIIVLSNGRIIECDSPQALLNNTNSEFYCLAKEANIV